MHPTIRPPAPVTIDGDVVAASLDTRAAVGALRRAFAAGLPISAPQRTNLEMGDGTFLIMPASGRDADGGPVGGVKVVTIRPANPDIGAPTVQAMYLLFGGRSLAPLAVIDGPALTNLRTAAVSALATDLLAPPHADRLVLFGAGAQAAAHLAALTVIRPIRSVRIVSRSQPPVTELLRRATDLGLDARAGTPDDVADADIVCCCTTSRTPLFDGASVRPGAHVVAVGAYRPDMRELDETTLTRGRVVVEDRAIALAEAGEFAIPVAAGRFDMSAVAADLTELCGGAPVRRGEADITVFKSVGMAAEDLAVADAVYRAVARAR